MGKQWNDGSNTAATGLNLSCNVQAPPIVTGAVVNNELLGFHREDVRFISVPLAFYRTHALATAEQRGRCDRQAFPHRAKRLECGAFTAAFRTGVLFFSSPGTWDSGAGAFAFD